MMNNLVLFESDTLKLFLQDAHTTHEMANHIKNHHHDTTVHFNRKNIFYSTIKCDTHTNLWMSYL